MATQSLTIQLGLNGLSKVTAGLGSLNKAAAGAVGGIAGGLRGLSNAASGITGILAAAAAFTPLAMAGRELSQAVGRMDDFQKSAAKLGESVETVSELAHAARMSEVELSSLEDAMRKLANHNAKAGIGGSLTEAFYAQAEAISATVDPTERLALVTKVFGERGAELLPMLAGGRLGLRQMGEEAKRLGVIVSTDAAKSASEFSDEIKLFKARIDGLSNSFANGLTPSLTHFAKVANGLLQALPTAKVGDFFGKVAKFLALDTGGHWVKAVAGVTEFASKLFGGSGISESLTAASKAAQEAYNKLIGTLFKAEQPLDSNKTKVQRLTAAMDDLKRFNEIASRGLNIRESFITSDPNSSDAIKRNRLRVLTIEKLMDVNRRMNELQSRAPKNGAFTDETGRLRYTEEGLKFQEEAMKLHEERAPLTQQLDTLGLDDKQMQFEAAKTGIANFMNEFQNMAAAAAQGFQNAFLGATSAISGGIEGLIMGTKNWGSALTSISLGITQSIVRAITDMAAQWLVAHVFMKGVSLAWSSFTSAMRAKDVATANAAEAAKMPALAANATLASIGSWGVAVAIGLGAMAAIIAGLGGFQQGGYTGDGAPNQIAGLVHRGEYVLDAPTVSRIGVDNLEAMRAGDLAPSSIASSGGSIGGSSTVNVATFDSRMDARKWAESQDSETWFVDMVAKTSHKWRRG